MVQRISVIGMNGCGATVLMAAVDTFVIANLISSHISGSEEPLFDIQLVSPDGKPIRCSNGHTVSCDGDLSRVQRGDVVICQPFSMTTAEKFLRALDGWGALTMWLGEKASSLKLVVATGSAVFLLAEAGLLDGKKTSAAWWFEKVFQDRYSNIELDMESICVETDNLLCAGQNNCWQDAYLAVVEKCVGRSFAKTMSRYVMHDYERRSQLQAQFMSPVGTNDAVVNKADTWIQQNLAGEIRIEDIAAHVAVSPRTLVRRFQLALGESPLNFLQKARVEKCKLLLELSDMTFSEIVNRCGYTDERAFRRLFKKHCNVSPREYRDQLDMGM